MRVLELFSGIGGLACAVPEGGAVVGAVDQHAEARGVYAANFPAHPCHPWNLATVSDRKLAAFSADLWWMSPPCQPFTVRGRRRDVDDPRCAPLRHLVGAIGRLRPTHLALENVEPFLESRMRVELRDALDRAGYHVRERILCPTELGVPMRRRRYYLAASLDRLPDWRPLRPHRRSIADHLDRAPDPSLRVPDDLLARFGSALLVADARTPCLGVFTGAYGRSPVYAGSYWRGPEGLRWFSPREILRFLGFPERYALPVALSHARAWPLVGNSLSVTAAREVLHLFPWSRSATLPARPEQTR